MKKDIKFGGHHHHGYQTLGGPIMTSYKDHHHISASPYPVDPRHQFAHYTHHHQYPSAVDPTVAMTTSSGSYPMGNHHQYGDFPTNVYPNYYAAAVQAGLPGLSLSHQTTTAGHGQVGGETATISSAAYQPTPTEVVTHSYHQSCSSSQGNSPTDAQMHHQAVNPAYLQVSGSQGGSPQQQEAEVTSQAQHYQQYQVASNQVM